MVFKYAFGTRTPSVGMAVWSMIATACMSAPGPFPVSEEEGTEGVDTHAEYSGRAPHLSPEEVNFPSPEFVTGQAALSGDSTQLVGADPHSAIPYWDAGDLKDDHHSGHLWIVKRAVAVLADHADAQAAKVTALMQDPKCTAGWQQGLFDADLIGTYNGGWADLKPGAGTLSIALAGTSWQAHFYDPDTGKNYKNNTDTAYARALRYVGDAMELLSCDGGRKCAATRQQFSWDGSDYEKGCYALGLALHFTTDISQPMHAALFTAVDYPIRQHTNVEKYAMTIQDRYELAAWSPSRASIPNVLLNGARSSKALWPSMKASLASAYEAEGCWAMRRYWFDKTECWEGDPQVDAEIGAALELGQRITSDFLYGLPLR
jgi:hypothetical protein